MLIEAILSLVFAGNVNDLSSKDYKVRKQAETALVKNGYLAALHIRNQNQSTLSPDVRAAFVRVLAHYDNLKSQPPSIFTLGKDTGYPRRPRCLYLFEKWIWDANNPPFSGRYEVNFTSSLFRKYLTKVVGTDITLEEFDSHTFRDNDDSQATGFMIQDLLSAGFPRFVVDELLELMTKKQAEWPVEEENEYDEQ